MIVALLITCLFMVSCEVNEHIFEDPSKQREPDYHSVCNDKESVFNKCLLTCVEDKSTSSTSVDCNDKCAALLYDLCS